MSSVSTGDVSTAEAVCQQPMAVTSATAMGIDLWIPFSPLRFARPTGDPILGEADAISPGLNFDENNVGKL
jgi:hypothetical protein